ncbi:MAG: LytTR family transcriptional regulator [Clostridia bacterium]|nr:LytTR family transcriptional regulator [Clostridia bacterium]MBQ5838148.1 LytTR family transcriptional regulator [Clostridia bacterium]
MGFKVRVEIDPECDEEIIIRCRNVSDEIARIESLVSSIDPCEMELELGNDLYFVKTERILFFETDGSKTAAHTVDRMYYTDLKLYELEERLPKSFMRISKSCIININAVSSIHKEITGICEAFFRDTVKKVYVSRGYYKQFREKINETRLKQ